MVIKMIVRYFLVIVLTIYSIFAYKIDAVKRSLDDLYLEIKNRAIDYELKDVVLISFDYEVVEECVQEILPLYDVDIIKNSHSSFELVVYINFYFIDKEIKENYQIIKGEKYEEYN